MGQSIASTIEGTIVSIEPRRGAAANARMVWTSIARAMATTHVNTAFQSSESISRMTIAATPPMTRRNTQSPTEKRIGRTRALTLSDARDALSAAAGKTCVVCGGAMSLAKASILLRACLWRQSLRESNGNACLR